MHVSHQSLPGDFAVIDAVRRRYQMYVRDAAELAGLIVGYGLCAGPGFKGELDGFRKFVKERFGSHDPRLSWTDYFAAHALGPEYEVSLLLRHLDEYRGVRQTIVAEVGLSHEQRRFDFDRRNAVENIEYPRLVLLAPHRLRAVLVEGVGMQAFFFDADDSKYYEQGFPSFERLSKWAAECYRIEASDWVVHDEQSAAGDLPRDA